MALSGWEGVWQAPDDDEPRLVLADQLLARGDPLGEFITLSCRRERLGAKLDAESTAQLAELWSTHGEEFQSRFGGGEGLTLHFSRGLPSRAVATAERWLQAGELPAPIQRLELSEVRREQLPLLLSRPGFARLSSLTLRRAVTSLRWAARMDPRAAWGEREAALLAGVRAPRLRHLGLHLGFARSEDFARLLEGPFTHPLQTLDLGGSLGDDTELALLPLLSRARPLHRLSLSLGPPAIPERLRGDAEALTFHSRFGPVHQLRSAAPAPGGWRALAPLGLRPGLEADEVEEADGGRRAVWLRASCVNADVESPRRWFHAPDVSRGPRVEPLHAGDADDGLWLLAAVPEGPPVDGLAERRAQLTPVEWAAALAPLAAWAGDHPSERIHVGSLFLGPGGVTQHRLCPDFNAFPWWRDQVGPEQVARFAPEELRGLKPTAATTVYAFAALVCELSRVELVKPQRTAVAMMQSLLNEPADVRRADIPGELAGLLHRALEKQPGERPTPRAFAEGLARFRDQATSRAPARIQPGTPRARAEQLARLWLDTRSVFEQEPVT